MPYLRHSSPADNPAACSFSTLMICSSVNLLLRMSVSLGNGLYPKTGAFKGSRSPVADGQYRGMIRWGTARDVSALLRGLVSFDTRLHWRARQGRTMNFMDRNQDPAWYRSPDQKFSRSKTGRAAAPREFHHVTNSLA